MTGFEPRTSGIRSDRSTNWATTYLICNYSRIKPSQKQTLRASFVNELGMASDNS